MLLCLEALCVVVFDDGHKPLSVHVHCCPVAYPHSSESPTCRGMRPSRGVPRGCLPGLDFVSLSADVFLCLRTRSPRPRSPRQRPRPRPRCSQHHWPAVTLSGKLCLAQPASPRHGMRSKNTSSCCLLTDRQLATPPFLFLLCVAFIAHHNWTQCLSNTSMAF